MNARYFIFLILISALATRADAQFAKTLSSFSIDIDKANPNGQLKVSPYAPLDSGIKDNTAKNKFSDTLINLLLLTDDLLGDLETAGASVFSSGMVGDIEIQINSTTAIWHDSTIRNGFDKVESITSFLGPALIAVGTLLRQPVDQNASKFYLSFGSIITAAGPLLKLAFGGNEDAMLKIIPSIEQVELSRKAYNDLEFRGRMLQTYATRAADLLMQLVPIKNRSNTLKKKLSQDLGSITKSDIVDYIDSLIKSVASYDLISNFVSDYTQQIEQLAIKYQKDAPSHEKDLQPILDKSIKFRTVFTQLIQEPFLSELPVLRTKLVE